MEQITAFKGDYFFLSNFYRCSMLYAGCLAPTAEHHYQAAKTVSALERDLVLGAASPGIAKRLGRNVTIRSDWEESKVDVMREILQAKFGNPVLRRELLSTGDTLLIEGNTWGDRIWGTTKNSSGIYEGENLLGKLLMELRASIRQL